MFWLTFVTAISLLFAVIIRSKSKQSLFLFSFLCLCLILTAGLRNMGGVDYFVYEDDYLGIKSYDGNGLKALLEFGYTFLVTLCNKIGLSYNEFILFYSTLSLIPLFVFIWKHSSYPFLVILLYLTSFFVYYNMVALRQMLPMSILLYAMLYLSQRRFIVFFLLVALGTIFHTSFIILLPCSIFLIYFKVTLKNIGVLLLLSFIIKGTVAGIVENFIFNTNYASLANRAVELVGNGESFSVAYYLKTLVISIGIIYYRKFLNTRLLSVLLNAYIISIMLPFVFSGNLMIFRLSAYFSMSTIILIPEILKELNLSIANKNAVKTLISIVYILMFYRSLMIFDDGAFFNFKFYFL